MSQANIGRIEAVVLLQVGDQVVQLTSLPRREAVFLPDDEKPKSGVLWIPDKLAFCRNQAVVILRCKAPSRLEKLDFKALERCRSLHHQQCRTGSNASIARLHPKEQTRSDGQRSEKRDNDFGISLIDLCGFHGQSLARFRGLLPCEVLFITPTQRSQQFLAFFAQKRKKSTLRL